VTGLLVLLEERETKEKFITFGATFKPIDFLKGFCGTIRIYFLVYCNAVMVGVMEELL